MAAYLFFLLTCSFFLTLTSEAQQNDNHKLLIQELQDTKLKISRLGKDLLSNIFTLKHILISILISFLDYC